MKKKVVFCLTLCLMCIVAIVFLGEMASRVRFREEVYFIRNPDHRLVRNSRETNSDGIRCGREAADFHPDQLNVIILGDSFVYGNHSRPEFALPQQFEQIARAEHPERQINVANFGWGSSSPYLSLRLLRDIGHKYSPDVVFLCVDVTDYHDDIKYKHFIEKDRLIYKTMDAFPGLVALLSWSLRELSLPRLYEQIFDLPLDVFFVVNQPLSNSRPWLTGTLNAIDHIALYVRDELQARFVLVILPRSFQYSAKECPNNWEKEAYAIMGPYAREPFRFFSEVKTVVKYPIYSLLETFETSKVFPLYLDDDPHWTKEGNTVAARALYDIATDEGIFFEPSARSRN